MYKVCVKLVDECVYSSVVFCGTTTRSTQRRVQELSVGVDRIVYTPTLRTFFTQVFATIKNVFRPLFFEWLSTVSTQPIIMNNFLKGAL